MAFVLIFVGAVLFLTAIKGTTGKLGALLLQDVFGGFVWWAAAILAIGALGYIKTVRPLSDAFLVLVVLVLLVANRGFFNKLTEAIAAIKTEAGSASTSTAGSNTASSLDTPQVAGSIDYTKFLYPGGATGGGLG